MTTFKASPKKGDNLFLHCTYVITLPEFRKCYLDFYMIHTKLRNFNRFGSLLIDWLVYYYNRRSYVSFRQMPSMNLCDRQTVTLGLKKYDFYIDKIQALFVPSLEYKLYSLLKEFLHSTDCQLIKKLSYFKRFIDAIIAWSDPLSGVIEHDENDTMEGVERNSVKRVMRDDLIICFLDSTILYRRLNKICRELDSLGIDDNILRTFNAWSFVNQDCYTDHNYFTIYNTAIDYNTNLEMTPYDARKIMRKETAESLTIKKIYRDESIEHVRSTVCQMQKQQDQQILYSDQSSLQSEQDNMNHCTRNTNKLQNDDISKIYKSFNYKFCNVRSKRTRSVSTLKIIVRKMYLENAYHLSRPIIIRLFLPCKMSDLIQCIFEIDPFLGESCLIMIRRKFQTSMYNVCSCLNDSLRKLNAKMAQTLRLDCNIRLGYISFKLKADGTSNATRYLFVARVPICQNICKHTIQQDSVASSHDLTSNIQTSTSECFKACDNDNDQFNDTCTHVDEKSKKLNNMCCSCLDQSPNVENLAPSTCECERENKEETICTITEKIPEDFDDLMTIYSCDKVCENITKEICNVALHADKLEEGNEKCCKTLDSIDRDDHMERYKKNLYSNDLIIRNDKSTKLANDTNYTSLFYDISIGTKKDIVNINSKNLRISSQIIDEHERPCLLDKELNAENKYHDMYNMCINTCITSFIENSDQDKQIIEMNCNLQNKTISKQSHIRCNNSLNSIKTETGCVSNSSRQYDDFINITVIDNISKENIIYVFDAFQDDLKAKIRSMNYFDAMRISSSVSLRNNLLTTFVQTPRLMISSKDINVDISYPQATDWLLSDDDRDMFIARKKCDNHKESINFSTRNLILKRENKNFLDADIERHNTNDGMRKSAKSSDRDLTSKKEFRSSKKSRNSDTSTNGYLRAENSSIHVTSKAPCFRRLIAIRNNCITSQERGKSKKSRKLRKQVCKCERLQFDINGITSRNKYETIQPRRQDDYFADECPKTTFTMTRFRDSFNRSINRLKQIRAKLRKVLFNKRTETVILKNEFWKNKGFLNLKGRRKKTTGRCIRQSYGITSYPTYDYCKQNSIIFSHESSNALLIRKNRERANSERKMRFHDRRSSDSSEVLSSFHSMIQISSQSCNLSTCMHKDSKERKSIGNNQQRYRKERNIENKQGIVNRDGNSRRCDLRNRRRDLMISSSAELSFAENYYPKYLEYYTRKRQRKTRDKKHVCERNQQKHQAQHACTCNERLYKEISSSYGYGNKPEKGQEQFYHIFRLKNVGKFSSLKNNRQMFDKITNMFDYYDNNCLHKKCASMVLAQNYNNYVNDIDLDFKLKLLQYVELCKSVKRALMRTF